MLKKKGAGLSECFSRRQAVGGRKKAKKAIIFGRGKGIHALVFGDADFCAAIS